jgi:hypothetical protein
MRCRARHNDDLRRIFKATPARKNRPREKPAGVRKTARKIRRATKIVSHSCATWPASRAPRRASPHAKNIYRAMIAADDQSVGIFPQSNRICALRRAEKENAAGASRASAAFFRTAPDVCTKLQRTTAPFTFNSL